MNCSISLASGDDLAEAAQGSQDSSPVVRRTACSGRNRTRFYSNRSLIPTAVLLKYTQHMIMSIFN